MRRAAVLILLLALIAPAARAGSSASALVAQGNQAYQDGQYDKACEDYAQALAAGAINADLYYNLGTAELRRGRLGPAIADYLRAQRLAPRDPDLRFNLAYARERISARLPDLPQNPLLRAGNHVADSLSANEWTGLGLALYWIVCAAGAALVLAAGRRWLRRGAGWALVIAGGTLVLGSPLAAVKIKRDVFTPRAVIVAEKVTARSGPAETYAELFELREGMDVVVGACESGWCQVSAAGGFIGHVQAESFERL
jgi:tetratricopeptide (TPR) repeat protein